LWKTPRSSGWVSWFFVTRNGKAGRFDPLLEDPDPEAATRYEVEIQLGATDESHIIRTLEYWDIERNVTRSTNTAP
jgi:hypothetical protein